MSKHKNKRQTISAYDRVMRRTYIPTNKDECWLWCGPVNNAGYGMIRGDYGIPKMATVHRVVAKHHGLDIDKYEAQHICLTKHCVNPKHLVEGNVKDRTRRIIKKHGRWFSKPKNPYMTCEHCGKTTHVVWFGRMHKYCYPGMMSKYTEYMRNKLA